MTILSRWGHLKKYFGLLALLLGGIALALTGAGFTSRGDAQQVAAAKQAAATEITPAGPGAQAVATLETAKEPVASPSLGVSYRVLPHRSHAVYRKSLAKVSEQTKSDIASGASPPLRVDDELSRDAGRKLTLSPPLVLAVAGHPVKEPTQTLSEKKTDGEKTTYAFGGSMVRMPRWLGSPRHESRFVPYIDINCHEQIEFSTVNGLVVDLLHGDRWHGGLVGTMTWGRSRRELGSLDVPTLKNTVQAGVYLEYALIPELTAGMRLRHDIQGTGVAYADVYAELSLPAPGHMEHDLRLAVEGMNRAGMRRFFGLSEQNAVSLGVAAYSPRGGAARVSLTYEGFVPTSESTGIAFAATVGRLGSGAADSPLIRNFGSPVSKELMAAFVYHF